MSTVRMQTTKCKMIYRALYTGSLINRERGDIFIVSVVHINDILNLPLTPDIALYTKNANVFYSGKDITIISQTTNISLKNLRSCLNTDQVQQNTH